VRWPPARATERSDDGGSGDEEDDGGGGGGDGDGDGDGGGGGGGGDAIRRGEVAADKRDDHRAAR